MEPATTPPDVSVIIPGHNVEATVSRAIRSVDTERTVLETIFVDDNSIDRSYDIAREAGGKIRTLRSEGRGAPAARNLGLARCAGGYAVFLDADDYVEPGFIDAMREAAAPRRVVIGSHHQVTDKGELVRSVGLSGASRAETVASYLEQPTQTACFLWPVELLRELGGWDDDLPSFQDVELALRMFKSNVEFHLLPSSAPRTIWVDAKTDQRISLNLTEPRSRAQISAVGRHAAELLSAHPEARGALHRMLYRSVYRAYLYGYDEVGSEGENLLRQIGLTGHVGSRSHRVLSGILGLRGKVHLARAVRALARRGRPA